MTEPQIVAPPRNTRRTARGLVATLLAAATIALASGPASACSLALVVAMDGSASVDPGEHDLQRGGLASALSDPEVVAAIELVGGIWFSSFEWSGRNQQAIQLGWQFITDQAGADAAAAQLAATPRAFIEFPTALGYALGFAAVHLKTAPQRCARQVIDMAGDGVNNDGFGPDSAYKAFDFEGVTVNGLVIASAAADPLDYYRTQVIRGPGAFVEVANGFADYAVAMKRKLIREITSGNYSALPAGLVR